MAQMSRFLSILCPNLTGYSYNLALAKSPTGISHTQKNHIFACFFAFVKLERLRVKTKLNHFALKAKLYFNAIRASFSQLQKLAIPST